eukprot:TRINITY_DN1203_c1_g1_i11.p3 TRINITY_DN1203_c1_g1~~TRINITY_DN1203_c1_g1_i11.p3  ORF type:complete len:186 (+),score=63.95 TRINITY_DN1203_c1_g1_i11:498-1055(+)
MGSFGAAISFIERALTINRRHLGDGHPETRNTAQSLADIRRDALAAGQTPGALPRAAPVPRVWTAQLAQLRDLGFTDAAACAAALEAAGGSVEQALDVLLASVGSAEPVPAPAPAPARAEGESGAGSRALEEWLWWLGLEAHSSALGEHGIDAAMVRAGLPEGVLEAVVGNEFDRKLLLHHAQTQ